MLDIDVSHVRAIDWRFVDRYREMRRRSHSFWSFLRVPIDGAQEWWDRKWSWILNSDGSWKPNSLQGPASLDEPPPDDAHRIDDLEELREHMINVHRLEYAREDMAVPHGYHGVAHSEEAEDREWDRRFRSSEQ